MSEESSKYLEKADQALKAAEILQKEQLWADAVSRSYYAMFYATLAALSTKEIHPKTHKGTLLKFNEQFILTKVFPKETGRLLSDVFEKRQSLDYTLEYEIGEVECERIVEVAGSFLHQITTHLTS